MHRWSQAVHPIDVGPRNVAVMFADLRGIVRLIESMGAEMAVAQLAPLMDRLLALVLTHDGVVQRIVGGTSMSVFGLRSESGDVAEQAVNAGLAFVRAADQSVLPVHIGIECGQVVVSRSWEPSGFAVWGDTVTAAEQLCDSAGPGTVRLGPRAFGVAEHVDRHVNSVVAADRNGHQASPGPHHRRRAQSALQGPPTNALTRAEVAVARLVAEGLSNPQIASRLYISRHTAETHMKHIFAKLGVSSRAELAARIASHLVHGVT